MWWSLLGFWVPLGTWDGRCTHLMSSSKLTRRFPSSEFYRRWTSPQRSALSSIEPPLRVSSPPPSLCDTRHPLPTLNTDWNALHVQPASSQVRNRNLWVSGIIILYDARARRRASRIVVDPSHPAHCLIRKLKSGCRFCSIIQLKICQHATEQITMSIV